MQVQVLFFGGLRETLACHQTVETVEGERISLTSVRRSLLQRFPKLAAFENNTRLALNEEFLSSEELATTDLRDGDVLAFIPPVTGG